MFILHFYIKTSIKKVTETFVVYSLVAETSFGILVEFMDITEPLSKLRDLLEQRTGMNLSDYQFYLQDTQEVINYYFFICLTE